MSNGSNIVLLALEPPQSGKYSCEVSADAPSFHTTIVSAEMEVVGELKLYELVSSAIVHWGAI